MYMCIYFRTFPLQKNLAEQFYHNTQKSLMYLFSFTFSHRWLKEALWNRRFSLMITCITRATSALRTTTSRKSWCTIQPSGKAAWTDSLCDNPPSLFMSTNLWQQRLLYYWRNFNKGQFRRWWKFEYCWSWLPWGAWQCREKDTSLSSTLEKRNLCSDEMITDWLKWLELVPYWRS